MLPYMCIQTISLTCEHEQWTSELEGIFLEFFGHINKIFMEYTVLHQRNIQWHGKIFFHVVIFWTLMELGNGLKLARDENFGSLKMDESL